MCNDECEDESAELERIDKELTHLKNGVLSSTSTISYETLNSAMDLLQQQISLLTHWCLQIQTLKSELFLQEQAMPPPTAEEQADLPATASLQPQISAVQSQLKILGNLLGCQLLKVEESEFIDRVTHLPISAFQVSLAMRGVTAKNPLNFQYTSSEEFLAALTSQTVQAADWYVLEVWVQQSADQYSACRLTDKKVMHTFSLLNAKLLGRLSATHMQQVQAEVNAIPTPSPLTIDMSVERSLCPLPAGYAVSAAPIIQHAIEMKDVAFLLRELPHAIKQ